ncbi:MAG: SAM-dependent methyltransferase [Bacteroidota bacterium]|nr:SAM-dependent methyltransferase [Bacteroidota bacterium]
MEHPGLPAVPPGTLFLVGTPIGNPRDLSPRAGDTLRSVDLVVCEDRKEGLRILRQCGVNRKRIIELNEHTEEETAVELIDALLHGLSVALFSDCGMPVLDDPGGILVRMAIDRGISIIAIPGPTSVATALALCGFDVGRYYYAGFVSAKTERRRQELYDLRHLTIPVVFLETPYRLKSFFTDLARAFGSNRRACAACDLTSPHEKVIRGTLGELAAFFQVDSSKRECVAIVEGKVSPSKGVSSSHRNPFRRKGPKRGKDSPPR